MAGPDAILLKSLRDSGIRLPGDVSSVGNLEPAVLISICAQLLNLTGDTEPFPISFPDSSSISDEVEVCMEMASAIKSLGYQADISFHQFLYPSEEESREVIRFLMERISESSEIGRNGDGKSCGDGRHDRFKSYLEDWIEKDNEDEVDDNFERIGNKLNDFSLTSEVSGSGNDSSDSNSNIEATRNVETLSEDQSSKMRYESKTSELEHLEEELSLLKAAVELTFDDQHSIDFHLDQLKKKVDAKKQHIHELNSKCYVITPRRSGIIQQKFRSIYAGEDLRNPLEEEKKTLQNSLYANSPETQEKFQRLKEIEVETRTILSEIDKRKDELSTLSREVENQPKAASRKSYIDRVKEITKNSRKQDADIERILRDTRELQLESNSIQERLHRTYAVVDEMVFREAKKDPVGRQAYRLLTSIHECFEQISEKILTTDRVRREVAERQKKLAAMASRIPKVEIASDLDPIRRENDQLEKTRVAEEDENVKSP